MFENLTLLLYSNNFFSLANYIMIIMLLYEVIIKRKCKILKIKSLVFVLLILSSLSYLLIYINNGYDLAMSTMLLRFIGPIVLFYLGYNKGLNGYDLFKKDIYILAFGSFLHGLFNVIKNINVNILEIAGRQYQDIYGGTISATLQNLFFVLNIALFFYFIFYEKDLKIKIIGILSGLFGIYGTILNASRTLLYLFVIIFAICSLIHLILKHGKTSGFLKIIMYACILIIFVNLILWLDLFGINEWFSNTALGQREISSNSDSSFSQNLRWTYAFDILKLLPRYPFGNIPYEHYAHNLWLDIAKETGIIPFVLYILFVIISLKEVIKYLFKLNKCSEKIIFIISIVVPYILVFFTEPIMIGAPMIFSTYSFIIGGIIAQKNRLGQKNNNIENF